MSVKYFLETFGSENSDHGYEVNIDVENRKILSYERVSSKDKCVVGAANTVLSIFPFRKKLLLGIIILDADIYVLIGESLFKIKDSKFHFFSAPSIIFTYYFSAKENQSSVRCFGIHPFTLDDIPFSIVDSVELAVKDAKARAEYVQKYSSTGV